MKELKHSDRLALVICSG